MVTIFLVCSSCGYRPYKYKGQYDDLYTVATNSILWNSGKDPVSNIDFSKDPYIKIIEKDKFDRTLFVYTEYGYLGNLQFSSLVIMQKSDKEYCYYYPDYNFICKETLIRESIADFTEEEIAKLKQQNDWDNEIVLEKCEKKLISNYKTWFYDLDESELDNILFNDQFSYCKYITDDNYARKLVCLGCNNNVYVAIINPDGTYDLEKGVFTPTDLLNYQDELKAFKELNNWNKPFDETQS